MDNINDEYMSLQELETRMKLKKGIRKGFIRVIDGKNKHQMPNTMVPERRGFLVGYKEFDLKMSHIFNPKYYQELEEFAKYNKNNKSSKSSPVDSMKLFEEKLSKNKEIIYMKKPDSGVHYSTSHESLSGQSSTCSKDRKEIHLLSVTPEELEERFRHFKKNVKILEYNFQGDRKQKRIFNIDGFYIERDKPEKIKRSKSLENINNKSYVISKTREFYTKNINPEENKISSYSDIYILKESQMCIGDRFLSPYNLGKKLHALTVPFTRGPPQDRRNWNIPRNPISPYSQGIVYRPSH